LQGDRWGKKKKKQKKNQKKKKRNDVENGYRRGKLLIEGSLRGGKGQKRQRGLY